MPDALDGPIERMIAFLGSLAWVLLLSALLLALAGMAQRGARRWARRHGVEDPVADLVAMGVRVAILCGVAILLLSALLGNAALGLLVLGFVLVACLVLWRGLLQQVSAGIVLRREGRLAVGEWVQVGGERGAIAEIGLRSTLLDRPGGTTIVPNDVLLSQSIRVGQEPVAHRYRVASPYPVDETFGAIARATEQVQVDGARPAEITIIGASDLTVEFAVTIWDESAAIRSDAFIAALKAHLQRASVALVEPAGDR